MTDLTSRAYLFHDRALENKEAKEEIANEAIKLVSDHMCIFLDASSTAYTLGMKLSGFTELTVITNGINLALELKDTPGVTVILTGGIVTSASAAIEGLLGADLLKKIHTDIAFVSARGFSVEDGLTDFSIYEADLKRMCIKASAKTVALVDHTKFDTTSISSYASLDDINMVITDSGISLRQQIYMRRPAPILLSPESKKDTQHFTAACHFIIVFTLKASDYLICISALFLHIIEHFIHSLKQPRKLIRHLYIRGGNICL